MANTRLSFFTLRPASRSQARLWLIAALVFLPLPLFLTIDIISGSEYRAESGSLKSEDFFIFNTAGKLASGSEPESAYDYGKVLSGIGEQVGEPLPDSSTLPRFAPSWPVYLYSPPVTVVFMALAQLPFWTALGLWLLVGLGAVLVSVRLFWRVLFAPPALSRSEERRVGKE